jgi:tetratricopeptide (TPR) repeat protein
LKEAAAIQEKIDTGLFAAQRQVEEHRYAEAIENLEGVLKVKPNSAKAHGKLGTLYAVVGQHERAMEHLRAVAEHDPDDAYGYNMLGWLAYLKGDGAGAVEAFRRADEISPFTAEINHRWGLALLLLGRWAEGDARFRQVLLINPKHAGACQGLSQALNKQGHLEEALSFALRAARLTRFQNADPLLTLIDAYAALGRWSEAEETATRALNTEEISSPHLLPQIRQRLEELRARSQAGPR